MRKIALLVMFFAFGLGWSQVSLSEELTAAGLGDLEKAYRYFFVLDKSDDGLLRYMYADVGAHVHVYVVKNGRSELEWETATLGSAVTALFVTDLDADKKKEIVVSTARGRIIVYDAQNYNRISENFIEPFESISCMTAANIDDDPHEEIIFIAENHLNIYDGESAAKEWRSQETYQATEIILGNVDDDPQMEIILSTGAIIDSRFRTLESSSVKTGGFGTHLRLLDMNGDGHPEIIGETPGDVLKIYDVYAQREVW
jgi:outer membrane protein assembly factor BamB